MKTRVGIILVFVVLFLNVGVCASEENLVCEDNTVLSKQILEEGAIVAYWEGYNKCSCKDVRVSLIVFAIQLFMKNPNLSRADVLYIESVATMFENFCIMGIYDQKFSENNLTKMLEIIGLSG
ncbi:MAG: hypothetical protein U9O55_00385 [Patescibacteria group bacterium]|nr:hypothetical protein [Patescibacteria group bacterium]